MMTAGAVESRARDAELLRAIGPGALAANIVNMIVGAGIFVVPAALAASVGAYAPVAFLICAGVVGAFAVRRTNFVAVGLPDVHSAGRAMILALFALTGMEGRWA